MVDKIERLFWSGGDGGKDVIIVVVSGMGEELAVEVKEDSSN